MSNDRGLKVKSLEAVSYCLLTRFISIGMFYYILVVFFINNRFQRLVCFIYLMKSRTLLHTLALSLLKTKASSTYSIDLTYLITTYWFNVSLLKVNDLCSGYIVFCVIMLRSDSLLDVDLIL